MPLREKEQLVDQLQTQIVDLERFVSFLQLECAAAAECGPSLNGNAGAVRIHQSASSFTSTQVEGVPPRESTTILSLESTQTASATETSSVFGRIFGCRSGRRKFVRNSLKQIPLGNHYGDHRARMELAVDAVLRTMRKHQILSVDRSSEGEIMPPSEQMNEVCEYLYNFQISPYIG